VFIAPKTEDKAQPKLSIQKRISKLGEATKRGDWEGWYNQREGKTCRAKKSGNSSENRSQRERK